MSQGKLPHILSANLPEPGSKLGEQEKAEKDKKVIEVATMHMKKYFPIESVILFGSKAKGKADDESDIDLILLTKRPISWKERKAIIDTLFALHTLCILQVLLTAFHLRVLFEL